MTFWQFVHLTGGILGQNQPIVSQVPNQQVSTAQAIGVGTGDLLPNIAAPPAAKKVAAEILAEGKSVRLGCDHHAWRYVTMHHSWVQL